MNKPRAKYKYTDAIGNVTEIIVRADNAVVACNQHRYCVSLCNVGFMMSGGYAEREAQIRKAAREGLQALRSLTKLPIVQIV